MEFSGRCLQLSKMETRRWVAIMVIIATAILVFQSLALPSRNGLSSLIPAVRVRVLGKQHIESGNSLYKPAGFSVPSVVPIVATETEASVVGGEAEDDGEMNGQGPGEDFDLPRDGDLDDDFALDEDGDPDERFLPQKIVEPGKNFTSVKVGNSTEDITSKKAREPPANVPLNNIGGSDVFRASGIVGGPDNDFAFLPGILPAKIFDMNGGVTGKLNLSSTVHEIVVVLNASSKGEQGSETLTKGANKRLSQGVLVTSGYNSTISRMPKSLKQRKPPITISEMNNLLLRNRMSSRLMKPRWSSACDRELLSAKMQIENAPAVKNDLELYGPVFQNVSVFKRSYELMERKLKVYVYKEGEKPIFHTPFLRGIYASEGWFMKLMEGNKQFVVKHPQKAHLFYLPFSSRVLRTVMITPESRNRRILIEYLKTYVNKIAAKYPFWNRTAGEDHFVVACHDWAPYETRKDLRLSLRALCNADASKDFMLGKDISLPVTNIRSSQDPLKNLGGNLASERPHLAFFAGNMHGKIRPILLQYWENKDPDMKIFGPMPGADGIMTYVRYMKNSKYCICPKGYEVHSPRVVEAIFYECVPVIISDNYVPPFFEVLDWEAFAVFVAEKDIPLLKEILMSIPEEKYRTMQLRVRKVQRHFLWHTKPIKYDIFHMILHSVWFNRLYRLRTR